MEKLKNRDRTVDIMRGICIILVVCGHCRAPFKDYIYLFHVAVFFMISGYFWNDKNAVSVSQIVDYIKRKIKTLWLPFTVCSCIFTLLNNVFIRLGIYTNNPEFLNFVGGGHNALTQYLGLAATAKELLKDCLFLGRTQLGGALWFLRVLFVISVGHAVLRFVLLKIEQGNARLAKALMGLVVIITLAGAQFMTMYAEMLPRGVQPFFAAYLAYLFGIAVRSLNFKNQYDSHINTIWKKCAAALVSFCLLLLLGKFGSVEVNDGKIVNVLFYSAATILGWILVWSIADMLKNCGFRWLAYIGEHSISIVMLHFISFKLVSWLYLTATRGNMLLLASYPVLDDIPHLWIAYSVVGVLIPILLNWLYTCLKQAWQVRAKKS